MPKDFGGVMHEFKHGELHSGSKHGPVVTNPQQAKAIAESEQREMGHLSTPKGHHQAAATHDQPGSGKT